MSSRQIISSRLYVRFKGTCLVSVDCCFFAFFGVFSGDFWFLYSRSIPGLLLFHNYFLSVSQWAPFTANFHHGSNL